MRCWRFGFVLAVGLANPPDVVGQPCPAVLQNIDQQSTLSMTNDAKTCSVPDGGFIKAGASNVYRRHVDAWVTGTCQPYARTPAGSCVALGSPFTRTASSTQTYINGASGVSVFGNLGVQNYNTCSGGGCTPVNTSSNGPTWVPYTVGTYMYTATNVAGGGTIGDGVQYCNMSGYYASENTVTVHAVACQPAWNNVGNPSVTTHLPPTTISLYIPPDMWDRMVGAGDGPAIDAIMAYNNLSSQTGVTIEETDTPCGTGGNCIEMGWTTDTLSGCAVFTPSSINLSTGEIQAKSTMILRDTWANATDDRLQRTVAHELGHAFGLNHNACNVPDSIMSIPTSCTQTDSGMTLVPTTTDILPTTSSTFGNHVQAVCGF
jgi:hypothetical protein